MNGSEYEWWVWLLVGLSGGIQIGHFWADRQHKREQHKETMERLERMTEQLEKENQP
jgi:uncharacterized membrane protein YuzA (DUF378 family)